MKKTGLFDGGGSEWDENDHPRDGDGKFTSGGGFRQNASYEEIMSADKQGLTNSEESGTMEMPQATGFNRIKTRHHQQHIAELGFKNEKEYIRAAIDFFNSGEGELYIGTKRNDYARYDEKRGLYATCGVDGAIKTFFPVGVKRFNKIKRQEGFERCNK